KNKSITKEELENIFKEFLQQNNIDHFSVMGFSLGGKIALQLTEFFSNRIELILLFAPDGLMHTGLIQFATGNLPGREIFKRMIKYPSWFLRLLKLIQRFDVIDKKLIEFIEYSLNSYHKRQQLWNVWICFRH